MPLPNTFGAASARGFGLFGGVKAQSYWIATLGNAQANNGNGMATDSSGNLYISGFSTDAISGYNAALLAKYDNSGIIQWQRTLGNTASAETTAQGITLDSSGNVYAVGATGNTTLITKYDGSGTIQWQKTLSGTTYSYGIATDSSANVYTVGMTNAAGAGSFDVIITKYDTSGVNQWQRTLGDGNSNSGYGIAVDSSGNVYVVGTSIDPTNVQDLLVAKYNTSGTIQWQKLLRSSDSDYGYGVTLDSSGNLYVTGYYVTSGNSTLLVAKYNSSGVVQWQRSLGGSGTSIGRGAAVDSSGNVYLAGYCNISSAGLNDVLVAKYDSSGVIQWQRLIGGSTTDSSYGISIDSYGNPCITGSTNSSGAGANDVLILKLPKDGSKTGTYGSFTYAVSNLTDASTSLTEVSGSLTDASASLTTATSTLTDAASSLTSTVTTL